MKRIEKVLALQAQARDAVLNNTELPPIPRLFGSDRDDFLNQTREGLIETCCPRDLGLSEDCDNPRNNNTCETCWNRECEEGDEII